MDDCDAVIVGGGPAGSTMARALTRAGLRVVVIDRAAFPRDKTCAGWITPPVLDALELDPATYGATRVLQPITGFRVGTIAGTVVDTPFRDTVSYGIRRCEFDDYLLRRSGARLELGDAATSFRREGTHWIVNDRLRTTLLVGAGGHRCPVAKFVAGDEARDDPVVAAQEVEFRIADEELAGCPVPGERPELRFCRDLQGYGWVFRKGDYLNIGLGRLHGDHVARDMSAFLSGLAERGIAPARPPVNPRGHAYLLYPHSHRPLAGDGVLLIGDSAGMAYAESGEGIRPAIESALFAAATVLAARGDYSLANLVPYTQRVQGRFGQRAAIGSMAQSNRGGVQVRAVAPAIGRWLLSVPWFARQVVVKRWFLRQN